MALGEQAAELFNGSRFASGPVQLCFPLSFPPVKAFASDWLPLSYAWEPLGLSRLDWWLIFGSVD